MKIISKVNNNGEYPKQYICTGKGNDGFGCGSTLEITKEDLYKTSHTDYTGDTAYFTTFMCINCGVETDIDARIHDLPNKQTWLNRKRALEDNDKEVIKNSIIQLLKNSEVPVTGLEIVKRLTDDQTIAKNIRDTLRDLVTTGEVYIGLDWHVKISKTSNLSQD